MPMTTLLASNNPSIMCCALIKAGNKEEMFFDSRAWLDSDCEDDFFSVNGGQITFPIDLV